MQAWVKAAALAALAILSSLPALAADCPPLSLITSMDLTPAQDNRGGLVPVTLGGKPRLLLLDTGGAMTEITPQAADELGLTRARSRIQLFNVSGEMSNEFVHTSLELGRLKAADMVFMIAPGNDAISDDPAVAGVLAPDVLRHYDVDLDFGANKLNLLSQDHCDGKVVYWQADAVAVVPIRVMDSGHIQLTVMLDGKPVLAMLDTGAYNSTLTQLTAQNVFGLTLGAADTPVLSVLSDRPGATVYRHMFKSLAFEGIAVNNAQVDIIPDFLHAVATENATPDTGSHIAGARSDETQQVMLLGMNILRHFHIYIAYKERKLYITPTAPGPAH